MTLLTHLDGPWAIATDPTNTGVAEEWYRAAAPGAVDAPVPGIIQQVFPDYHGLAWYWREFEWTDSIAPYERVEVRFERVDYAADVWLNGSRLGRHEGSAVPFSFDVTASMQTGRNLLCVRVLNPTDEAIDGITLGSIPHANTCSPIRSGNGFNCGVLGAVTLVTVPAVRIVDVHGTPNWQTGEIDLCCTLAGDLLKTVLAELSIAVKEEQTDLAVARVSRQISIPPGTSINGLSVQVSNHRLWSLETPFLYRIEALLQTDVDDAKVVHEVTARTGFRDFRVVDGYFHLNGKRIFLKSAHSGNHCPVGVVLPPPTQPDMLLRDLIYAKASGFNMVRFISTPPNPDQLDLCDRIGLMVYAEPVSAWLQPDVPNMKEQYDSALREMVLRDRNHPSLTVWGLLNETFDGNVFRNAVEALGLVRALDSSRLVLLSSGRWDNDFGIGSVSNPGSTVWEHAWGDEKPGGELLPPRSTFEQTSPRTPQAGDFHYYPQVPHDEEGHRVLRTIGAGSKPILLSEYGIGSMWNVTAELAEYRQAGARPDLVDADYIRGNAEKLAADWKRFGFDSVYAFPEDMLRDSQLHHAQQRALGLSLVRANPQICGHNLTGLLDHGYSGEGLWTFWRHWKPGTFDAISEAWAPLRWCLFVEPMHGYTSGVFRIHAVLVNESVLETGSYDATFRIVGPNGPVWERAAPVTIGEGAPMAVQVLSEDVTLDIPEGEYLFAAGMESANPAAARARFRLSSHPSSNLGLTIAAWQIGEDVQRCLLAAGIECVDFASANNDLPSIIVVGKPEDTTGLSGLWEKLNRHVEQGAVAVFFDPAAFALGDKSLHWLPLMEGGRCTWFHDWLYHRDIFVKRHMVFDGVQGPGILNWDDSGALFGSAMLEGLPEPIDTLAASFATGHPATPSGYCSSPVLARYAFGVGSMVLNTLRILENVGTHPSADQVLVNLIRYAAQLTDDRA